MLLELLSHWPMEIVLLLAEDTNPLLAASDATSPPPSEKYEYQAGVFLSKGLLFNEHTCEFGDFFSFLFFG